MEGLFKEIEDKNFALNEEYKNKTKKIKEDDNKKISYYVNKIKEQENVINKLQELIKTNEKNNNLVNNKNNN